MIRLDYLYDRTDHDPALLADYFSPKKLGCSVYENVYLVPQTKQEQRHGIYDRSGSLLNETSLNKEYDVSSVQTESLNDCDVITEPCLYLGVYESCWGHFLTDGIKKLWVLNQDRIKDLPMVLIAGEGAVLGENHKRFLAFLGIDVARIRLITRNTLVRSITVPDSCFFYDDRSVIHYTQEYVRMIEDVRNRFPDERDKRYEKIYFSYAAYRSHYKKTFGEKKLERFFEKQGFLVVHPERHSLDEQMTMLANCRFFASTEGSCSHNSLFLKDGSRCLIIPRGPYLSGYQQTIDSMHDLDIDYVDSSLTAFAPKNGPWSGPNYFYVSEELMAFFRLTDGEKECWRKKNFGDMKSYLTYCLVRLSGRNYDTKNIYAEKFFYYLGLKSGKIFPGSRFVFFLSNAFRALLKKPKK